MSVSSSIRKGIAAGAVAVVVSAFFLAFFFTQNPPVAVASFEHCNNQTDDDWDMLVDCADSLDCALAINCTEDCFNETDDDGDGAIDCDDFYCAWFEPECEWR